MERLDKGKLDINLYTLEVAQRVSNLEEELPRFL